MLEVPGSQEGAGVKILPREFDNLLGLDPATIHKLEALQVDNLKRTHVALTTPSLKLFSVRTLSRYGTDQYGRQPPEVQLLGGQPVGLALGAVVEFVLSQLLLTGESLQTAVQADGLSLSSSRLLHTAVLLYDLQEEKDGEFTCPDAVTVERRQSGGKVPSFVLMHFIFELLFLKKKTLFSSFILI